MSRLLTTNVVATTTVVMDSAAAEARTAKNLRVYINALGQDLARCTTAAETRAVKVAIRAAEFKLTDLAVAS